MAEKIVIPQKVINAFTELIEMYGNCIEYLGEKNNKKYYWFNVPENIDYGFPPIIYLKNGKIKEIVGFEALDVLNLFDPKD